MDRNTVIGFVLITILAIFFIYYNQQNALEEAERIQRQQDSLRALEQLDTLKRTATEEPEKDAGPSIDEDSLKQINTIGKYGVFSSEYEGQEERLVLENENIKVDFTNRGGKIEQVQLKAYKTFRGDPVFMMDTGSAQFYAGIPLPDRFIYTDSLFFEPVESNGKEVVFRLDAGEGKYLEHRYSLEENSNFVHFEMQLVGFDGIISRRETNLTLTWAARLNLQERDITRERDYSSFYYRLANDDDVDDLDDANIREEAIKFNLKWISFNQQFFNSTLVADDAFNSAVVSIKTPEDSSYLRQFVSKLYLPYESSPVSTYKMRFYYGPNGYKNLKQYDLGMEEMVPMGSWGLGWINKHFILPVFNFFGRFTSNYGLIILFLAIFIKIILSPLTFKSYKSMAKMKVLKPEIDEIKEKFKDDMQKQQMETMKLYRKTGVSMMGGCLPMLLQMPILIAMYRFFPASIQLRQEGFLWAHDLSTYDNILPFFGMEALPFVIPFYGDHVSLFTLLMAASSILYAQVNSQMSTGGGGMAAQMKMFQYIMPFFLVFIFNSFSAGLTYYYLLYNVLSFVQQFFFKKFFINEDKLRKQIEERRKKPVKVSKWQKKLEQMQKSQQQQQRNRKGKR